MVRAHTLTNFFYLIYVFVMKVHQFFLRFLHEEVSDLETLAAAATIPPIRDLLPVEILATAPNSKS
jgi:hypothetical protein